VVSLDHYIRFIKGVFKVGGCLGIAGAKRPILLMNRKV